MGTDNRIKPLRPEDIIYQLPGYVINAVNNIIKKYYRGTSFKFKQDELINEIIVLANLDSINLTSNMIFDQKLLDIETTYISNGWQVKYESPDRGQDFDAYYEFTPKQ